MFYCVFVSRVRFCFCFGVAVRLSIVSATGYRVHTDIDSFCFFGILFSSNKQKYRIFIVFRRAQCLLSVHAERLCGVVNVRHGITLRSSCIATTKTKRTRKKKTNFKWNVISCFSSSKFILFRSRFATQQQRHQQRLSIQTRSYAKRIFGRWKQFQFFKCFRFFFWLFVFFIIYDVAAHAHGRQQYKSVPKMSAARDPQNATKLLAANRWQ